MLVIRKEQMEALSDAMRQRFIDREVSHLNAVFPDKLGELPNLEVERFEESLRGFIVQLMVKAGSLGIVSERDVSRYIDLVIEFGDDFEKKREMRWASSILANKRLSGSARITLLYEQLPFKAPESRLVTN